MEQGTGGETKAGQSKRVGMKLEIHLVVGARFIAPCSIHTPDEGRDESRPYQDLRWNK